MLSTQSHGSTDHVTKKKDRSLRLYLARHQDEVEAAQRLRYEVFSAEYGAQLSGGPGLDQDEYDPFCEHLIVEDENRQEVVGTYRLFLPEKVPSVGRYYAETEFDLSRLLALNSRIMELGRSCVHPDYRQGGVITLLWSGLAEAMSMWQIDYLMGCASVHSTDGPALGALYQQLQQYLTPQEQRVFPLREVPGFDRLAEVEAASLPSLLKGYLRAGVRVGGEPFWDPQFHCADFFVWCESSLITPRYQQRFLEPVGSRK
ncbi:GNAT family N-acetyltransferase [Acidithiobacillus thiooxidans]|jgi:putative hemolysin|uniref:L-ornithine N(alpha)-acyltransferase n=1 Tax=Acidithiobacillus thiooxidans ATCC 19377 TaxID=637390 RepID=A0A5P9XV55_ACITH|nr:MULTISPECIES: GNAT family N-acyltransferase [Acidithiobacillus]MBU2740829.1 GNAT family N-acetyltransferase [Acidithiobacillus albertensis]MBU2834674.1 GNAT family N-acetyltransferase [Acidithiobacillus thiooxidans]MBU2838982.1 GNAT family N-acetyltransferase [Acidithiobacillus thiooxidans]MDA8177388.1 GNAT family N-acetyltransferase [Acidithiobacillus sp.]QFX97106.1 serine protease [Acidithiobacillus thiooxidans ATCC 19377]